MRCGRKQRILIERVLLWTRHMVTTTLERGRERSSKKQDGMSARCVKQITDSAGAVTGNCPKTLTGQKKDSVYTCGATAASSARHVAGAWSRLTEGTKNRVHMTLLGTPVWFVFFLT